MCSQTYIIDMLVLKSLDNCVMHFFCNSFHHLYNEL